MWQLLGSWPFVIGVFLIGAVALATASRRTGRWVLSVAVLFVASVGVMVVSNLPLSAEDGTICVNRATPYGMNHVEVDAVTAEELGIDRFACRNALRSRYLQMGASFFVLTLGAAGFLGRGRRLVP